MPTTYLTQLRDFFNAAGEDINTALTDAGLTPLKDWCEGEPMPPKRADCPYGFWDFAALGGELPQDQLNVGDFLVPVVVGLNLVGQTHVDLVEQTCNYIPIVTAAIESAGCPYVLVTHDFGSFHQPDAKDPKVVDPHFRTVAIAFTVTGQRAYGGVL